MSQALDPVTQHHVQQAAAREHPGPGVQADSETR